MIALLRAWAGAVVVLVVGALVAVRLTPRVAPGESIPVSEQAWRLHLPWFVMVAVMVLVADVLHWRRSRMPRRLLTTAPVPLVALAGIGAVGAAGGVPALTALLYIAEGVLAAALGLVLTSLYALYAGDDEAYPYPGRSDG